jgi:hypothetical protein
VGPISLHQVFFKMRHRHAVGGSDQFWGGGECVNAMIQKTFDLF